VANEPSKAEGVIKAHPSIIISLPHQRRHLLGWFQFTIKMQIRTQVVVMPSALLLVTKIQMKQKTS